MSGLQTALLDKYDGIFVWCIAAAAKIIASCGWVAAADLGARAKGRQMQLQQHRLSTSPIMQSHYR
jgi:hypothetical protein